MGFQDLTGILFIVVLCGLLASGTVALWRKRDRQQLLATNGSFIGSTYPVMSLVYGVFLGFTIVGTWTRYQDAEDVVSQEVTQLSSLWRNSEAFPAAARDEIQSRLNQYAVDVQQDWDTMDSTGSFSEAGTKSYEHLWDFYTHNGPAKTADPFYSQAIGEMTTLSKVRRRRSLYCGAEIPTPVRTFLIGGGILTVLFSLLLAAPNRRLQMFVTAWMASVISFSILLALALQHPFSGDVRVDFGPFQSLVEDFQRRVAERTG